MQKFLSCLRKIEGHSFAHKELLIITHASVMCSRKPVWMHWLEWCYRDCLTSSPSCL